MAVPVPRLRAARRLALSLSLVLSSAARFGFAQSSTDSAAAQALFDQAKLLIGQGRVSDACPKLEESQRLDPGSGTLLNLADCYERTGRLASAWAKYIEAASLATAAGNAAREAEARGRGAALAPRVPKLVIDVPAAARVAGLVVTRNGVPVGAPQWGLPIPADSGPHPLTVEAPGYEPWRGVATAGGEATTTTFSIPPLVAAASPSESAPPTSPGGAPPLPRQDSGGSSAGGMGAQRAVALVVGGIGIVGLGVGTAFAITSKGKHDEAEKYCNGGDCTDQRGETAGEEAQSAGNIATIGVVAGGVGLVGGLVLWFTAPVEGGGTSVGLGPGTVRVRGVW